MASGRPNGRDEARSDGGVARKCAPDGLLDPGASEDGGDADQRRRVRSIAVDVHVCGCVPHYYPAVEARHRLVDRPMCPRVHRPLEKWLVCGLRHARREKLVSGGVR